MHRSEALEHVEQEAADLGSNYHCILRRSITQDREPEDSAALSPGLALAPARHLVRVSIHRRVSLVIVPAIYLIVRLKKLTQ